VVIVLRWNVAKVENQNEWAIKAKNILKAELRRKGVGYRDLAQMLSDMGTEISEQGVANKISRGGFSASFMVQCFEAIGEREIRL
jgi:hypothetical protein